jgi:metal-dependent amidase/aminoacylase/carboxypeptidase family protein
MFNQATADAVCALLQEGHSLRKAAEECGIAASSVLEWRDRHPAFAEQYARARAIGDEADFERLEEIAAEPPPTTNAGSTDAGWVAWKRLQIDTKKWALAKKQPKKYGDKLDLNHGGEVKITEVRRTVVDPRPANS